ncbi:MAG TPA: hypothetical protein VKU02_02345, partial [Gemmataceae bacterium]|nr:hypothetical protein [Gemmataceae bacterium]
INGSSNNRIGGINDGEANVIAYDGQASLSGPACNGVTIIESAIDPPAVGNTIRGNSIYRIRHDVTGLPHGLGIALGLGTPFRLLDPNAGTDNYAFRLNDLQHADAATGLVMADNQESDDSRPNHLQHYPVYLGTDAQGIGHWQLNSTPNRQFEIDFYSNSSPNPSGYGDGQALLTSLEVATDANGHVVFATPAVVAGQPYVSATATDAVTGDTSQFSMVNTSGDGLADAWKLWGIDVNGDGTPDLMLPGADVHERDLYVEIDAMAGRAPSANALNMVTQVFANHGIDLHLILGDTAAPLTSPWLDDAGTDFPEAAFDAFKAAHFGIPAAQGNPLALAAERLAFRYCVFADTYQVGTDPVGRPQHASGAGKGNIASDFFIALGPDRGGDDFEQAGTFMHELGHSLGLRHGGGGTAPDGSGDDVNNKPNYFSIMNYLWQAPFTDYADPNHPTALELAYHNSWELDYSDQALPTLDEAALDEAAGIGGDPTKMLRLADGSGQFVPMGGPVDWNQDGIAGDAPLVQRRLNDDPRIETLVGHEDWSQLSFYFLESPYLISRTHSDPPPPPVAPSEGIPVWIGNHLAANGTQVATWSRSSTTGTEMANSFVKCSSTTPNFQPQPAVSGSRVAIHPEGTHAGAEDAQKTGARGAWTAEAESVQHRDALFATVWSETC